MTEDCKSFTLTEENKSKPTQWPEWFLEAWSRSSNLQNTVIINENNQFFVKGVSGRRVRLSPGDTVVMTDKEDLEVHTEDGKVRDYPLFEIFYGDDPRSITDALKKRIMEEEEKDLSAFVINIGNMHGFDVMHPYKQLSFVRMSGEYIGIKCYLSYRNPHVVYIDGADEHLAACLYLDSPHMPYQIRNIVIGVQGSVDSFEGSSDVELNPV